MDGQRFPLILFTSFAVVALFLAGLGIYGVMSFQWRGGRSGPAAHRVGRHALNGSRARKTTERHFFDSTATNSAAKSSHTFANSALIGPASTLCGSPPLLTNISALEMVDFTLSTFS